MCVCVSTAPGVRVCEYVCEVVCVCVNLSADGNW